MLKEGQKVRIHPDWQDEGDDKIEFSVLFDQVLEDRVTIQAHIGLYINPSQTVKTYMIIPIED